MSKDVILETGQFDEIISIIENARNRALKAVNTELIQMYWDVKQMKQENSICGFV